MAFEPKSIEYFEKANLLFMEIDDKKGLNQVKMNEAYVYASMGKLEEFFQMNQEAIEFFESIGFTYHLMKETEYLSGQRKKDSEYLKMVSRMMRSTLRSQAENSRKEALGSTA